MITVRRKEKLEQAVKDNGNRENTITKKPTKTELSQKDKKRIAIVVNSIPIGYIIGCPVRCSEKQMQESPIKLLI